MQIGLSTDWSHVASVNDLPHRPPSWPLSPASRFRALVGKRKSLQTSLKTKLKWSLLPHVLQFSVLNLMFVF